MSRLSDSSFHGDEVADLTSVIAEFPGGDDNNGIPVPVKKLSDMFDTCATQQKAENSMRVFLRIRPMSGKSNSESTIAIESGSLIHIEISEKDLNNIFISSTRYKHSH
jgi:primosomal replication protein N